MIYKIKFNEDYSNFESWEKLDSKYANPQDYCKEYGDNKFLFVQKKEKPYIVVYHREGNGWARLPWKPKTWIKEYTPWNSMTEEQWIAAVKNFIPELNVTEKQTQTRNVNISAQQTSIKPEKQKKKKPDENASNAEANSILKFDFEFWNNKSESDVLDYLFNRGKRIYNDAKKRVPLTNPAANVVGEIPILWFGDYNAYKNSEIKVVTVGLNPSNDEFTEERFPSLSKKNINDIDVNEYFGALNAYFVANPYWDKWFRFYNAKLTPWNAGYRNMANTALHIDCWSPCATDPVWNGLKSAQNELKAIQIDTETGNDIFVDLVNFLKPDILLIPDSYWKNFSTPDFREITEMRDLFQDKIDSDAQKNSWDALHFYNTSALSVISGPNRRVPFSNINSEETLRLFNIFINNYFNL